MITVGISSHRTPNEIDGPDLGSSHRAPNEIVRLDFFQVPAGWVLTRYRFQGCYLPVARENKDSLDLEEALAWCLAEHWLVRRWPGGARVWKYDLLPVRSGRQAERMVREGLLKIGPDWAEQGIEIDKIDFRYDL